MPRWARLLGRPRRRAVAITEGAGACSGSTLAFSEYLREQRVPVVWVYRDDPSIVPSGFAGVRAGTARHRWLAARSRWWITDGLPMRVSGPDTVGRPVERGPQTRVLAFVEPTIQKVGSDVVDWPLLTPRQQRLLQMRAQTDVDLVAVPSEASGESLARAWGFTAPSTVGSPLVERVPATQEARARLGLADSAFVVGVVLERPDASFPAGEQGGLIIVSPNDQASPADIVGACDVLVTDVSSWAVVAARLDRPVIVYALDLRDLLSRGPGLYLPWQRELPGPHVSTPEGLESAVQAILQSGGRVPAEFERGHAALASLVSDRREGSCAALLAVLEDQG